MGVGFTALQKVLADLSTSLLRCPNGRNYILPYLGLTNSKAIVSGLAALVIVGFYVLTRDWMLSNTMAVALTLMMFKVFIAPSNSGIRS